MRRMDPAERESRRGNRHAAPKHELGPTGKFLLQDMRLWALFQPRPPLKYVGTITKKKCLPLTGFAEFTSKLSTSPPPKRVLQETPLQKKQRLAKEKAAAHEEELKPKIEEYRAQQKKFSALHEATAGATSTADKSENGANGANGDAETEELPEGYTKNPFCTLFIARLPFDITEGKLRRVFSKWGTIKKIKLLTRKNGEPRGMAFIEYEEEAQMRAAYERADAMKLGKNLDGKDIRILVDVERGRTVPDWLPRRLGGGLGGTRRGAARVNDRSSGRPGSRPVHDRGHGGAGGFRGGRPMDRGRDYNRDRDRGRGDRGRHDRDRGRDHDRGRYDRKDRDRRSSRDDDRKRGRY